MQKQGLTHTLNRYQTHYRDKINALRVVILVPHNAAGCRCEMYDILEENRNTNQLH